MRFYKLFLALVVLSLLPHTSNAVVPKSKKDFSYLSSQTTTGTLVGMVIDQQYNPIPGVLVKVINVANGFSYGRRTGADGTYRIDFLQAGTYDITAQADGYQPNTLPQFLVEVNREKIIKPPPIVLTPLVAPITSNTTTPTAINPPQNIFLQANIADPTLRGNATGEFLTALPLSGIRSFDSFALLVPGVLPSPQTFGNNGPGIGAGVGTAGQFSVNGNRARNNNFTIDGSDNNDQDVGIRRQGFTVAIPQTIESITEFQITTLLADAEAGRNTGGQVNVVSKTGETAIHGNVYDFFTDSTLNARDFFDLQIPNGAKDSKNAFTRNQVGATLGFPIIKNKMAFFTAFEHQDVNKNQQLNFAVPSLADRNQAFLNAKQFLGSGSISSLGQDLINLYPLPNNPGGPYNGNTFSQIVPAGGKATVFSIRLDNQVSLFGKASTFTTRYNFTDDDTRIASVAGAINASLDAKVRTQNLALTLNTEISQLTSNQIRVSYGRTALGFKEVAGSPLIFQTSPLFPDVNGDGKLDGRSGPIGRLNIAPFSPIGVDTTTFPQGRANNTFQFADTFVTSIGKHTIKFGTDIRRVQFNSFLDRNYRTAFNFTSNTFSDLNRRTISYRSGLDFAALGTPSNIFQALAITPDSTIALRFTETNFFIHDGVAVNKRINISYGLRYELNTVPKDATGRIEKNLRINRDNLPFSFLRDDLKQAFLADLDRQASFLGGRKEIYNSDLNNFAPRIGIAIDLTGDGRTALRGGYGLFYDQILGNIVSQSRNLFPNFIPLNFGVLNNGVNFIAQNPAFITISVPGQASQFIIAPNTVNMLNGTPSRIGTVLGQLLQTGESADLFGLSFTLPIKNFRTPYVHEYSLTLERTIADRYSASISYVGTTGRSLLRLSSPNGGQFTPLATFLAGGSRNFVVLLPNKRRPTPGLGAISIFDNSAESTYNSLQASFIRRTSNGFGFQLAYTYSHTIDDVSDLFDISGASVFAQDEIGRREGLKAERGNANFDVRHRFTAA